MNGVIKKRSEVVNTEFYDRHRNHYGALGMMDIDCMYYKYDEPCLMLELKYGLTANIDLADKQFTRLRNTANKLNIPAFCALYYFPGNNPYDDKPNNFGDYRNYYVIPINNIARSYLFNALPKGMTEKAFVELIYKIKDQPITPGLTLDDCWNKSLPIPRILSGGVETSHWCQQTHQWETRLYR